MISTGNPNSALGAYGSANFYDVEEQADDDAKDYNFRREIRNGFIRKVYGILFVLLSIATGFSFMCMRIESLQHWIRTDGLWLVILCAVGFLVIGLILSCCHSVASSYPTNYILLFTFAGCLSVMVGAITAAADPYIVSQAVLCTAVVVLGLTIFAFQTKYDFTSWYGVLVCITLGFLVFGIVTLFFPKNRWLDIVYCSLGAVLFSAYIIVDTALIIGRGKLSLSEDDYIVAAMLLFVDIINLFLYILRLLQHVSDSGS